MNKQTIKDSIMMVLFLLAIMFAIGTIERLMPDDISTNQKAEVHTNSSR